VLLIPRMFAAMLAPKSLARIPFVYKRASRAFRDTNCCPLYEQRREQFEFIFGSGAFRFRSRLTGFWSTRKIVSIRTNERNAKTRSGRRLRKSRLVHGK
jgi:hypothetical protein